MPGKCIPARGPPGEWARVRLDFQELQCLILFQILELRVEPRAELHPGPVRAPDLQVKVNSRGASSDPCPCPRAQSLHPRWPQTGLEVCSCQ